MIVRLPVLYDSRCTPLIIINMSQLASEAEICYYVHANLCFNCMRTYPYRNRRHVFQGVCTSISYSLL